MRPLGEEARAHGALHAIQGRVGGAMQPVAHAHVNDAARKSRSDDDVGVDVLAQAPEDDTEAPHVRAGVVAAPLELLRTHVG